jgi:hypothetical protein
MSNHSPPKITVNDPYLIFGIRNTGDRSSFGPN